MISRFDTTGRRQMSAWIDEELHQWLKIQAAKEDRNIWEIVEDSLRMYKAKVEDGRKG